ncbi:MAG TPA: type II secretion system protein GspL, partial [Candidatus Acidoferrum sp.]|nr:type II secretion system protein GspL [Candidatus Acidoferrum sp.]
MNETLFIRLPAEFTAANTDAEPVYHCALVAGPDGAMTARELDIAGIAALRKHAGDKLHIALLAPAESTLLTTVAIPSNQRKKIAKAVPFVVEEILADEMEATHIAILPYDDPGRIPLALIAHSRIKQWLEHFRKHGIVLDSIIPECLALPAATGELVLLQDNCGRVICSGGNGLGFGCGEQSMMTFFTRFLEQHAATTRGVKLITDADTDPVWLSTLQDLLASRSVRLERIQGNWRDALQQRNIVAGPGVTDYNLLQGPYRRANQGGALLQASLRKLAIAAAVLLALQIGFDWISGWYLESKAAQGKDNVSALYKELFPG